MVGDGRAGHIHHGGDVHHALLAVAQQPENAHAAAVGELLEHVRHGLEAADRLHRFLQLPHRALVAVLVG